MRFFYAAGFLIGSTILAASRPSEADRLRAENRSLQREVERIAAIADNLRVDLSRAEAMLQHPSHRGAVASTSCRDASAQILAKATARFVATDGEDFTEWGREFAYDQEADQ